MAACGASDSVISHTGISEELQVPLHLFSVSLHGGVMRKRIVLFFSFSFSLSVILSLCITSVTRGPLQSRHCPVQCNEDGKRKEMEEEKLLGDSHSIFT